MKKIIIALFTLFTSHVVNAQTKLLTRPEIDKLFPESVQQQLDLQFPIRTVYKYADQTGTYYIPFCERTDQIREKDTTHGKIRAVNLKYENGGFVKQWELNDFILPEQMEDNIWFFTKYTEIKDLDGDGVMDPVIVYGSAGTNGLFDGRIKILVYYKGKKVGIRHQNSEMDEGRFTKADKEFYELPQKVQVYIKGMMKQMEDRNHALYQHNWEQKMTQKKLTF